MGNNTNREPLVPVVYGSGNQGFQDGDKQTANFNLPNAVCVDLQGNIYVADTWNHRIRRIDVDGVVSTMAGTGEKGFADDQQDASAKFDEPRGICVDRNGNLYVADTSNNKIRKIDPNGTVSTVAGSGKQGFLDGPCMKAKFKHPCGVTVDKDDNIYVADWGGQRIRKISGDNVTTIAGDGTKGYNDAHTGINSKFNYPWGIAIDNDDNLIIADSENHRIRKIVNPSGETSTITGYSEGFSDGYPHVAKLNFPRHVAIDGSGNILLSDEKNHRIREITKNGFVSTIYGDGTPLKLNQPFGVAVHPDGSIVIADTFNHRIVHLVPGPLELKTKDKFSLSLEKLGGDKSPGNKSPKNKTPNLTPRKSPKRLSRGKNKSSHSILDKSPPSNNPPQN